MEAVAFRLRALRDAQSAAKVVEAPRAKFTVLVVDDDNALAKLVGMYVTRAVPDAQVAAVGDAERALASVRERPPDVMFMDLHMPRMNGIELCMMLRGMHLADQCTIVAVSAGASHADIDLLRQLGITRFVPKGADMGALLTTQVKELHQAWQRSGRASISKVPSAAPPSASRMPAAAPPKVPVARGAPLPELASAVSSVARESLTTAPDASRFLRLLARNLPGMLVLLFDRDLRVLLADGGAAAVFGLDRETVKGRTVFDVTGADRLPALQGLYQGAMRGESGEASFERGGRRFLVHAAPVREEGGALVCGMATIREAPRG
jgi:CheY-like chemotaxis protein